MVDGLGGDHQRLGDLGVGGTRREQVEHLDLARGQPGRARRARPGAGRAGCGARRRPAGGGAGGDAARAAPRSSKIAQRLEPRASSSGVGERLGPLVGEAERGPRGGRAAPVAGDRAGVRRRDRPSWPGVTGAPARHSHQASSPRAHASPRRSASAWISRAAATTPSTVAVEPGVLGPGRGDRPEPLQLAGRHRDPPRLVDASDGLGVAAARAQAAEHDERGADAHARLLAELERRVRVGLGRGPLAAQQPQPGARAEQVLRRSRRGPRSTREAQAAVDVVRRRAGRRGGASACPARG